MTYGEAKRDVLFDFSRRKIETDAVYKHRYSESYVCVRALVPGTRGVVHVVDTMSGVSVMRRIKRGAFLLDYMLIPKRELK